jgi:hypothetical protein
LWPKQQTKDFNYGSIRAKFSNEPSLKVWDVWYDKSSEK